MDKMNTLEITNTNTAEPKVSNTTLQRVLNYAKAVKGMELNGKKVILMKN